MLETIKTAALITSASVAFCAFLVGVIHYTRILLKKFKAKQEMRKITKSAQLQEEKIKNELYAAYIKSEKIKGK